MKSSLIVALNFFVAVLLPVGISATEPEKLVVRDLVAQGVEQFTANIFTTLMINELENTGKFRIYSKTEIQEVLNQIGTAQQLGKDCDTTKCILDFGLAMGADRVLAGEVGKVGSRYIVTLSLYNIIKGEREGRQTWECSCSEDDITDRVKGYALELLGLETPSQREVRLEAERLKRVTTEHAEAARQMQVDADRRAQVEADRRDREVLASIKPELRAREETLRKAGNRERILISDIKVSGSDNNVQITVTTSSKAAYALGRLNNPRKLILGLAGTMTSGLPQVIQVNRGAVTMIKLSADGDDSIIEVFLSGKGSYDLEGATAGERWTHPPPEFGPT